MRIRVLIPVVATFLGLGAFTCSASAAPPPKSKPAPSNPAPALLPEPTASTIIEKVLEAIDHDRTANGVPRLNRIPALDRLAESRALLSASQPDHQRMALNPSALKAAAEFPDLPPLSQLRERIILIGATPDPSNQLIRVWKDYEESWESALSPDTALAGFGWADAGDGWRVFIALLGVPIPSLEPATQSAIEQDIFRRINQIRQDSQLITLLLLPELTDVARGHSADMATRKFFDHLTPEGNGPGFRLRAQGIPFQSVSENIAMERGTTDLAASVVQGWMDSPGHRANILQPDFVATGVGIAQAADGTVYFTQVFLLP